MFSLSDSDCSEESPDRTQPVTIIPSAPLKSNQSKLVLQNMDSQSKLSNILKTSSIISKAKYLKHLILPSHARHSSKKMKLKNNFHQTGR